MRLVCVLRAFLGTARVLAIANFSCRLRPLARSSWLEKQAWHGDGSPPSRGSQQDERGLSFFAYISWFPN
jgi:hypothetical protein